MGTTTTSRHILCALRSRKIWTFLGTRSTRAHRVHRRRTCAPHRKRSKMHLILFIKSKEQNEFLLFLHRPFIASPPPMSASAPPHPAKPSQCLCLVQKSNQRHARTKIHNLYQK